MIELRAFMAICTTALVVTACAPTETGEPPASKADATTSTVVKGAAPAQAVPASTTFRENVTSQSLEYRAKPAPPDFKLPFPDAMPALRIEPGKRGGTFTIVNFGEGPKTFNPITSNESSSSDIVGRLFDGLIGFDNETQEYYPALLKEWYMDKDPRVWILKLRSGIKWSDGHPITADDIMFTVQVIYDKNVGSSTRDILQVDGKPIEFEKVDDLTVKAKSAVPSGVMHVILGIGPIPKHVYEQPYKEGKFDQAMNIDVAPEKIVCSGPFKLQRYDKGQRVILEPNPHYYRFDRNGTRLPYLDSLIFTYVPDMNAQLLRFQRGECDGLVRPSPDSVPDMMDPAKQAKEKYKLYDAGPGEGGNLFWFNLKEGTNATTGKPFVDPGRQAWYKDPRFRKAVMHAFDKESIIRTELRGLAANTWSMESPANKAWYNPNLPKYEFSREKAVALLEEMGMKDRDNDGVREDTSGTKVSFTFITNKGNKIRERVATLLSQDLKAVGVDARPQFVDFNALVTMTADTFEYDACLLGLGGGGTHPVTSMNVYRSSGQTHLFNPKQEKPATPWEAELDDLANRFSATLDIGKQKEIYHRMQMIMAEQLPVLPLWTMKVYVAVRDGFGNVKPTALSHELLWNADEIYVK